MSEKKISTTMLTWHIGEPPPEGKQVLVLIYDIHMGAYRNVVGWWREKDYDPVGGWVDAGLYIDTWKEEWCEYTITKIANAEDIVRWAFI